MSEAALTDVISIGEKPALLRQRRVTLKVSSGPDAGAELASSAERLSLGTMAGNDLVLTDRTVSRFHAELVRSDNGYRLHDLGSTNGTFVGNVRVVEAFVGAEATLRLGSTTLRLSVGKEQDDLPLHPEPHFGRLIGGSVVMRALFARLAKLSASDATVMILGETGTGKELAAEALHQHGARAAKPLVVVDCGSIPGELVESELFGHERGAFTGATTERCGAFEAAEGGTIFLDEIGELPLAVQPKLLRVLESRQVKRVGADRYRPVNVRVVAATHRDLRAAVNRGSFREDLYFRLAVATVRLPPLRDYLEDLPLLLGHLWKETLAQLGLPERELPPVSPEVLRELQAMPWEGNVRELRNFVEGSLALSRDLDASILEVSERVPRGQAELRLDLSYKDAKALWVDHFERAYLGDRLARAKGNVSQAARDAEMDRAYLIKLMHKHLLR
ncbi:MAG: sigma 54-interacting transcriptional regulator [Myxococcaceae bacterium]